MFEEDPTELLAAVVRGSPATDDAPGIGVDRNDLSSGEAFIQSPVDLALCSQGLDVGVLGMARDVVVEA